MIIPGRFVSCVAVAVVAVVLRHVPRLTRSQSLLLRRSLAPRRPLPVCRCPRFNSSIVPVYRIELVDGRHLTLGQYCHYLEYWATIPNFPNHLSEGLKRDADGACDPGAMPIARADVLTNTFVIGFLQSVFRGEPPLETTLTPVPADVVFMVK
jgi:hypothetical protein